MSTSWTEETRSALIAEYLEKSPTPETTAAIVEELSHKFEATINGVRAVLSSAKVYVSQNTVKPAADDKPKKRAKQDSLDDLTALFESNDLEVDDTIISKLTGKAAEYFITSFTKLVAAEE
tara:strand:- start:1400 stop:1762 length:363 start_codon:yes stop_codon:yes gene_type:complete